MTREMTCKCGAPAEVWFQNATTCMACRAAVKAMWAPLPEVERKEKTRGAGTFRYTLPDRKKAYPVDQSGLIPAKGIGDAKKILRTWLQQQALPKGTTLERVPDSEL